MATDEEYLDNLLKAAMEDEGRTQGNAFGEAEEVDEEEDWKNSLDEMLASVNTAENEMSDDIDMSDIDFSDFTDGMDESGIDYSETEETGLEDLDVIDFGIPDLGADVMDEAVSEDADMGQDAINDLLNMSDIDEAEESQEESAGQEGQEAETKKSRKELQEEKRLAKEAKKEEKRLAKEEKRMAKERKKDEKKAEKERAKEAKKSGAFSSFIDFLTAEEEEETVGAGNEAGAEGLEGVDGGAVKEADSEEQAASGKKGKKEKKKKKGKKGKGQSEGGEGEEGDEGEAAPDPKQAAKQAKKALKEQKKLERAEQKANEPRVKVLNRKTFLVLIAFCATIVAAVVFLSVFLSDYVDKTRARSAFNNGDYSETYELLYGKELNSGDQVIYYRVSMWLQLERKLEVYEHYLNEGEIPQALDILLQGVSQYNEMVQGDTYGAGEELRTVYLRILDILNQQYGLSEEEALELLTYDDIKYSRIIYELTLGVDFGLPGKEPQEPQSPQDILPEEEDIINMEVTGEGV